MTDVGNQHEANDIDQSDEVRRKDESEYVGLLDEVRRKHESLIAAGINENGGPKELFHYTTTDALVSIIEGGRFWATDFRYMNDASELDHGTRIFREAVEEFVVPRDCDAVAQLRDRLIIELDAAKLRQRFFMVCFCEEPNLLSQWRAYGDRLGRGSVSLGFETRQLRKIVAQGIGGGRGVRLVAVNYDLKSQREKARLLINDVFEGVAGWRKRIRLSYMIERAVKHVIQMSTQYIVHFKDPCFRGENEWRLLEVIGADRFDRVKYRPSAYGLSPYLEIDLTLDDNSSADRDTSGSAGGDDASRREKPPKKLPLKTIYVGPSAYAGLAAEAVQSYVFKRGYDYCGVVQSELPVRL
jgi:hypothetical protein